MTTTTTTGLAADDPRHGTANGYRRGCRLDCCRRPHRVEGELWRHRRPNPLIDATGCHRRVGALMAAGWSQEEIARACGRSSYGWVQTLLRSPRVTSATAAGLREGFEVLDGRVPPATPKRPSIRRAAERAGHVLASAWWDIDDPDEDPTVGWSARSRFDADDVDEVLVERVLGGDWSVARSATRAERLVVADRWPGSLAELERLSGWNVHRDLRVAGRSEERAA